MKTDTPQFKKALASLPKSISRQFSAGTPGFISWLREHRVPEPVVEHFAAHSVTDNEEVEIGVAKFWPEHLIRTFHDETPEYFGAGWLIFGSMQNGDFVVLDIGGKSGTVSYVNHEEIWDAPNHVLDDLHTITIRICDSVGQFMEGLLEDKWPYDYYDAKEQQS